MELEIRKALAINQERLRLQEKNSDLSQESHSLKELDKSAAVLLDEIKTLHVDVEQRYEIINGYCDSLLPSYKTLLKTDEVLDIVTSLTKLNRLCRRLESSQIFNMNLNTVNKPGFLADEDSDNTNQEGHYDDRLVDKVTIDSIEQFKSIYMPLEETLSKRPDLPYLSYASRLLSLGLLRST